MSFISIFILMLGPCHSFHMFKRGMVCQNMATGMRIPIMSIWSLLDQSGESLRIFRILADVARRSIVTLWRNGRFWVLQTCSMKKFDDQSGEPLRIFYSSADKLRRVEK